MIHHVCTYGPTYSWSSGQPVCSSCTEEDAQAIINAPDDKILVVDLTSEKPKPPSNPFYPKSRNPE